MTEARGPVIGVDLGGTKLFAALADGSERLEHETYVAHHEKALAPADPDKAERVFERLASLIAGLGEQAAAGGRVVRGIGIGAPGITSPEGMILSAPVLNWRNFPLAGRLAERFGVPVRIENDVNLAALGELHFGVARGARSLVCMSLGTGIGGAVIVDGKLHRGRRGAAGEIGAFLPGPGFLGRGNPDWGALESVASGTGIAEQARRQVSAEEVFAEAATGASWATELLEETVDHLSVAVANIQALLDPEVIVLCGGMSRASDRLIPAIERRLAGALPSAPRLVASTLGYRAAVLGASTLFTDDWRAPR